MAFKRLFALSFYFTFMFLNAQRAFAAEPAFEAYYKFILGNQHSGYAIQRYEIDDKKKQITSTYFAYVKTPTGSTTESLVAKADLAFEPISYQYSALVDGKAKFVDGDFKNKKLTGKMVDGGKTQALNLTVPQNGFMSTFLSYVMLKNGLGVGKNYGYLALAEESPACLKNDPYCKPTDVGFIKGSAAIKAEEKYKDIPGYKVAFDFKGIKFDGYLSNTGETLGTFSPLQNAALEIVTSKEEAVANFPFSEKNMKTLFGGIPTGKKNSLYEATQKKATAK
jgi:hypothetical protein